MRYAACGHGCGLGVIKETASQIPGECTTASGAVCLPSAGTRIRRNVLSTTSDVFVIVEADQASGLIAEENTYCANSIDAARFGWQATPSDPIELIDFATWQAEAATDATSAVVPFGDPRCR